MSHHLAIRLPDGRRVLVDHREAVVPLIRRYNGARLVGALPVMGDLAQICAWVAEHPDKLCTEEDLGKGETCGGKHQPEPWTAAGTASAWVTST